MKTRILSLCSALLLVAGLTAVPASAQINTMYSTTTTAALLSTDATITLASVTNMTAPNPAATIPSGSQLYVIAAGSVRGESMYVQSINGLVVNVRRGVTGGRFSAPSGAVVLFGPPNWFRAYDPSSGCTAATTYITPHVNTLTGLQWLCSTVTLTWVPSWQNTQSPAQPTAAVASAAGQITPSGRLFHVTGTAAITGFVLPLGFVGDSFTIIPDGAFTATATNNIAKASTAVVQRPLTYTYDAATALFYPSY